MSENCADGQAAATAANTALTKALGGPAEVSSDAGSARQFALKDLILADQYAAGKAAACSKRRGLRFNRLIPGGTVSHRGYELGGGSGNCGWGGGGGYPD